MGQRGVGCLRGDYCVKGITRVRVWADSVWIPAKLETSSGNGSKGGWVLLLDRRDQKNAYSFVMHKEFAD